MLTIKQPVYFGYKSAHELPSPPSTSRPSPPLVFREPFLNSLVPLSRSNSPPNQPMSAPHRSLPPPAAMTLAPPSGHHPAAPPGPPIGQAPLPQNPHTTGHSMGQLPPPPPQWVQGAEESMRAWLLAKAEEEKRKAEEERTRQENLRLEQRRTEHDILRTSLQGGIPPPLVPVVFAGMGGGTLPQAAIDLAHQIMYSQQQHGHQPQLLPAGTVSPHRRDSQAHAYSSYPGSGGLPSTPGSAQPLPGGFTGAYPGSPTTRSRGYSVPGTSRPHHEAPKLLNINTNIASGAGGPGGLQHPGSGQQSQEHQQSPNIYFHYWQPPTTQGSGGSSSQPTAPAVAESPRKRKATGQPAAAPPPISQQQRFKSPPLLGNTPSIPPPGRGRGHGRQRSDTSFYRGGRSRPRGFGETQEARSPVPMPATINAMREGDDEDDGRRPYQSPMPAQPSSRGTHSLSALLSDSPGPERSHRYHRGGSLGPSSGPALGPGPQRVSGERRRSPRHVSEERARGGGGASATAVAAAAAAAAAGQGSRSGSAATRKENE